MKRAWVILLAGLIAGAGAFASLHLLKTAPRHQALRHTDPPELAWLRSEFKLTEEQFARIAQLHLEYLPECEEMCERIEAVHRRLRRQLSESREVTPEIEHLLAEAADLRRECQAAMLRHFYQVSQAMPEEQGRRYFERMCDLTLAGGAFDHSSHGH